MGKKSKLNRVNVPMTYEERLISYMRRKKSELAAMLAERDMALYLNELPDKIEGNIIYIEKK